MIKARPIRALVRALGSRYLSCVGPMAVGLVIVAQPWSRPELIAACVAVFVAQHVPLLWLVRLKDRHLRPQGTDQVLALLEITLGLIVVAGLVIADLTVGARAVGLRAWGLGLLLFLVVLGVGVVVRTAWTAISTFDWWTASAHKPRKDAM
jgi:hypothetical protein